ncbi:hypothetical protein J6590_057114 [Homalodisca vitripennis]|nr:hypothetical protein J6590_057114 [Homalodisca vitripennis]
MVPARAPQKLHSGKHTRTMIGQGQRIFFNSYCLKSSRFLFIFILDNSIVGLWLLMLLANLKVERVDRQLIGHHLSRRYRNDQLFLPGRDIDGVGTPTSVSDDKSVPRH